MRITATLALAAFATPGIYCQTDWPAYGHDQTGQRYSPLTQISTKNVAKLKLAWQYGIDASGNDLNSANRALAGTEAVPIMAGGLLYTPTAKHTVVALEPETGKEVWKFELGRVGAPLRGVTYWQGDKDIPAEILLGTSDGRLIALNAKTGKPVPGFGNEGTVNLRIGVAEKFPDAPYHMGSPGALYRGLIITGAQGQEDNPDGPAMDVRAWDMRTGKLVWTFHTLPRPGEPGYETWPKDNWISGGSPAHWGAATIDAQRGLVFLPVGQPAAQYYGGAREGQNLYSSSIVALDAATGKVRWYFQLTHHDMWDYDAEAAPALIDVIRDGKKIPAVVAISKPGLMFFLDRDTGKSIYPMEERAVPQSDIPGEHSWPTQPFPMKPPPLARTRYQASDLVSAAETTPEHVRACQELIEKNGGVSNAGPFTPWGYRADGASMKSTLVFPGGLGGSNWGGTAYDRQTGFLLAATQDVGALGWVEKAKDGSPVPYDKASLDRTFDVRMPGGSWPCQKPPWGQLIAINTSTGDFAWQRTLGVTDQLPEAKQNTGRPVLAGPIVTASGLIFIGSTDDNRFRALDAKTGREVWVAKLERRGNADPITYADRNGKQYVAIVATDTLVVYTLP